MTQVGRIFTTSIGGECSAVWYTSLFWTGWFGLKISFLNLFVLLFSTNNLLYWEELGYRMLGPSLPISVWTSFLLKFPFDSWTAQAAASFCLPQDTRVRLLMRAHSATRNDADQHPDPPAEFSQVPLLSAPCPHSQTQRWLWVLRS